MLLAICVKKGPTKRNTNLVCRIVSAPKFGAELGEGDETMQKSVKRSAFSLNEGKAFSE